MINTGVSAEMVFVIASTATTATLKYPLVRSHSSGTAVQVPMITPDLWLRTATRALSDLRNTGSGDQDILLLLTHIGAFDGLGNWAPIVERARGLAESYGAALVDMWSLGRNSWGYWNTLGYWGNGASSTAGAAGTDTIHPSDAGHQAYHDALLPVLVS
jgi:hypothetical protein